MTYYIIQSLKTGSPKYIFDIEGKRPSWVFDDRIEDAYKFSTLEDVKNYLSKFDPKVTEFWHVYKRPYDHDSKDIGLGKDYKTNNNIPEENIREENEENNSKIVWYDLFVDFVYAKNPKIYNDACEYADEQINMFKE